MEYKYLKQRGALQAQAAGTDTVDLVQRTIPASIIELVPESVAREHLVLPLSLEDDVLTVMASNPDNIAILDKLTFILNKRVRAVKAPREHILRGINQYYGRTQTESVGSMLAEFTDTAIDFDEGAPSYGGIAQKLTPDAHSAALQNIVSPRRPRRETGQDLTRTLGGSGMFFQIVEEGQRVLMRKPDGALHVIAGPARVWKGWNVFTPMAHFVAHPGEYLIVRRRDGRQEHLPGPSEVWFDPREHLQVSREDALQIAAKEAVVVYSQPTGNTAITRRIVHGPALFVPQPGEWLHTFSWHASEGGSQGARKVAKGLVFQKLWLMPDQMYHDVPDVRTSDDAVLTVRLMIFFELLDIERMLDTTHDPIGDFVNAATSDVIEFTSHHDFESFKKNTHILNELEAYRQLTNRASQCGYRINKVVYRGYGAPESLQNMHDQAIEARTKLQLERATEQQAQDLENYKLDCQLGRATKRRGEQTSEVEHDLLLARKRHEEETRRLSERQAQDREQRKQTAELQHTIQQHQDTLQQQHLSALRELGVDLTAFLTQSRADRVIELRGPKNAHVHVDGRTEKGPTESA